MPTRTQLEDEQKDRQRKSFILIAIVCLPFVFLILRLFWLQVVESQQNIRLSLENQMRQVNLSAPRGRIFDRNGSALAQNRLSYSIGVLPYQLKKKVNIITPLLKIRDQQGNPAFDSLELVSLIRKSKNRRFDFTRLKEDASIDLVSIIEEHALELPGIVVETEARREYPLGPASFHVLGYLSEIPETEFESHKKDGYHYGDRIGKGGIEKQYEKIFRGKDGNEYIEVNAYGKSMGIIKDMPRTEPVAGDDVYLSIDARLQKLAADSFPDTLKGAIVVIDPRNGDVLAMYSSPSVDPNIFSLSTALRAKNWAAIATDTALPLNNRATCGTYTPGSTFKLISATAGLETGQLTAGSYMPSGCGGAYRFGSRVAHCWQLRGHGRLNLIEAIKQSCNIYFFQVGLKLGDECINTYAEKFGLGLLSNIDFPIEKTGWLSGEVAYNSRYKKSRGWVWTRGLVLDLAIGQQQVVTPLQLAVMVGGLGSSTTIYRPNLLKETRNRDGILISQRMPVVRSLLNLKPETILTIHKALEEVIKPGGTGGRAGVPGVPVGGKTGSAENPQGEKTHALFVGCAPVDSPVIALSVVVENAGHGGSIAAPIAGAILRYFFAQTDEGRQIKQKYAQQSATKENRKEAISKPLPGIMAPVNKKPAVIKTSQKPAPEAPVLKPAAPDQTPTDSAPPQGAAPTEPTPPVLVPTEPAFPEPVPSQPAPPVEPPLGTPLPEN
jgi:penicillin-binding protein 2